MHELNVVASGSVLIHLSCQVAPMRWRDGRIGRRPGSLRGPRLEPTFLIRRSGPQKMTICWLLVFYASPTPQFVWIFTPHFCDHTTWLSLGEQGEPALSGGSPPIRRRIAYYGLVKEQGTVDTPLCFHWHHAGLLLRLRS